VSHARRLVIVVVCALSAGCGGSPIAPGDIPGVGGNPGSGSPTPEIATTIVRLTNDERAAAGIPALQTSSQLMQAAQLHAGQMASAQQMAHTLPDAPYPTVQDRLDAAGYRWQSYGENVASGYPSAAQAMSGWMQSSGHRANILNTGFTEMGAGYALDSTGRTYYVQVFGRPR
jgi:uncharacterized protein YkwD